MVEREESFHAQMAAAENLFVHLRAKFFEIRKLVGHDCLLATQCHNSNSSLYPPGPRPRASGCRLPIPRGPTTLRFPVNLMYTHSRKSRRQPRNESMMQV